jgi:hypothetical protein
MMVCVISAPPLNAFVSLLTDAIFSVFQKTALSVRPDASPINNSFIAVNALPPHVAEGETIKIAIARKALLIHHILVSCDILRCAHRQ